MKPNNHPGLYLVVLIVLFGIALALATAEQFTSKGWVQTAAEVGKSFGRLTLAAIGVAYIIVEGFDMLAERYRQIRFAAGIEEGRSIERAAWAEYDQQVRQWEARRDVAVSSGVPFNDPRPEPPSQS